MDFVIIGAGASGGVLAHELSQNGFSVVVLEQGPWLTTKDFTHNEYLNWSHSAADQRFPQAADDLSQDAEGQSREATGASPMAAWWAAGPSTSRQTTGAFTRLISSRRARKAPSRERDSPIGPSPTADLEPYYTKAEWDLGVSGLAGASPFDPPRSKPYPLPPMPIKSSGVLFEQAARKLGYHPFPAPMAILSQSYQGRMPCAHCGFCMGFGCEMGAKSSPLPYLIPRAIATGRCEIRPNSYVRKIELDAHGRATGAIYFDKSGKENLQRARAIIVAANGSETPRLLLLSKSNRFPDGLANSSGLVGKYLMFNTDSLVGGLFEHPLNEYKSIEVTRIMHDFYEIDPKHGFYGGGGIDARFLWSPISFATVGLPQRLPQWGSRIQESAAEVFHSHHVRCGSYHVAAGGGQQHLARRHGEGRVGTCGHARHLQRPS